MRPVNRGLAGKDRGGKGGRKGKKKKKRKKRGEEDVSSAHHGCWTVWRVLGGGERGGEGKKKKKKEERGGGEEVPNPFILSLPSSFPM